MPNIIVMALGEDQYSDTDLERVRSIAEDRQLLVTMDRTEIMRVAQDVEIIVGHIPRELLPDMPRLQWVQLWGAGADWLHDHPELATADFTLTNMSGIHAIPISEHILSLLLAFARNLPHAFRRQENKEWSTPRWDTLFELAGRTMLLIGVGAIGERTAQIASALGVKVIGVRNNPAVSSPHVSAMYGPDRLLELLPDADFVVLTLPLTKASERIIGSRELRAMKNSAIIVNVGRGRTIDEEALVTALQQGWIAGAALDVFAEEPLPQHSPLWDMDNVIMTCHYAGATPVYHRRAWNIFLDNLQRYVKGQPLINVVDKREGY